MKVLLTAFALSFASAFAWADGPHVHTHATGVQTQANYAPALAEGEVRRVDRAQGRLTLRHGPIDSLNMPPMTMVFRVLDPAWLDNLKVGDNIRFQAERINGTYTVTRLERTK